MIADNICERWRLYSEAAWWISNKTQLAA